jgi:hypothetical protein
MYVNYLQKDWWDLLPLTKFTYNNESSATTKHLLFYDNYGFHPHFNALSVRLATSEYAVFNAEIDAALIQKTHKALN